MFAVIRKHFHITRSSCYALYHLWHIMKSVDTGESVNPTTETEISSFWRNLYRWLRWLLFKMTTLRGASDIFVSANGGLINFTMTSSNGTVFPRYWHFVRGIHRSPLNSPHKGQWSGALMFSLICAWTNGWANHRDTDDLSRHSDHYDVTVMELRSTSTLTFQASIYGSLESHSGRRT